MDAAVFDAHPVAGLPGGVPAIVHVMAAALEHVEHRAVEVAVLLAVGPRRVGLDMRFHRLDDGGRLWADHALAELAGAALPRHVAGRIDPLLLQQRLVEVTVGASSARTKVRFLAQRSHFSCFFSSAYSSGWL